MRAGVKQALDSSCSAGSDAQNPTVLALNQLVVNYSQLRELLILKQSSNSPASSSVASSSSSSAAATTSSAAASAAATASSSSDSQYCVSDILGEAEKDTGRIFSKDNLSKFLAGSSTQMIELLQSIDKETYCNGEYLSRPERAPPAELVSHLMKVCGQGSKSSAIIAVRSADRSHLQSYRRR